MDFKIEYVRGDYEVESTVIKCHGFNVGGLFDGRICREVREERHSRVTGEKNLVQHSNNSSKESSSVQVVFGKYGTLKSYTKAEKMRILIAQNRSYEKKIIKMEKEMKVVKNKHEKQKLRLLNEIEEANEKVAVQERKLMNCRAQINQSHLTIASKDALIDTLQTENKRYKQHAATSSQSIMESLVVKIDELSKEMETLKRKLRQPWRIFGRSKLHKCIDKNNTMRTVLENMVNRLQDEIDRAQKL